MIGNAVCFPVLQAAEVSLMKCVVAKCEEKEAAEKEAEKALSEYQAEPTGREEGREGQ